MRGIPFLLKIFAAVLGIIPAHAGNTMDRIFWATTDEDHPRSCGEYEERGPVVAYYAGSSPLMRGILHFIRRKTETSRIIPAHAGNTIFFLLTRREPEDHPRSCGEYPRTFPPNQTCRGSSPLMRGIRRPTTSALISKRIIPAHAGNTIQTSKRFTSLEDHPRSCGEYQLIATKELNRYGIIPAHAGNTHFLRACKSKFWDHPRSCGEYYQLLSSSNRKLGSSPLMRGILKL